MDASLHDQHALLEDTHWWFVGRRAILQAVIGPYLGPYDPARRVLDVGCGSGGMLPMLGRFGRVEGMEADPGAVARCQEAVPPREVRLGHVPDDVPRDGSYDVVTAFDVIEHIVDDVEALVAMRHALRPGGTVVVTVPALPWLWSDHDDLNGHQRRYTRPVLLDALAAAGFETKHVSYFNTILLPAVAAARLAQRIRPRATLRSDFTMPSPPVNRILTRVLSSERHAVRRRGLPIGVSLVAVATIATAGS